MKIASVPDCFACPHYEVRWWTTDRCRVANKEIVITTTEHFPDWCPLPDAPEDEERAD